MKREELGICAAAVASKLLVDYGLPRQLRVPAGLLASAVIVRQTMHAGAGIECQALQLANVPRGWLYGVAAALPIAASMAAGSSVDRFGGLYEHRGIGTARRGRILYEALLRVPFGTALPEEIIFRGAVLGLLARNHGRTTGAALASMVFGVWHIVPALVHERHSRGGGGRMHGIAWMAASLLTTTAGGWCLSMLRFQARSVVAPWLAHTSANATGFIMAWLRHQQRTAPT